MATLPRRLRKRRSRPNVDTRRPHVLSKPVDLLETHALQVKLGASNNVQIYVVLIGLDGFARIMKF
jgi:hypothetical protein